MVYCSRRAPQRNNVQASSGGDKEKGLTAKCWHSSATPPLTLFQSGDHGDDDDDDDGDDDDDDAMGPSQPNTRSTESLLGQLLRKNSQTNC